MDQFVSEVFMKKKKKIRVEVWLTKTQTEQNQKKPKPHHPQSNFCAMIYFERTVLSKAFG